MWYALLFISFMDIRHLQLDLENEYSSYRECMTAQKENAQLLAEAINEELSTAEATLTGKPVVVYGCKFIDLRKA